MSENNAKLHGSWKLVSFEGEYRDSKERAQPLGANPNGYLILGVDGRMMALLTAKIREPGTTDAQQAALFRTMNSYTGRYRVDGERFITKVDASWNEAWTGTEQERFYKLDGDKLDIVTAWAPHPLLPGGPIVRGTLSWVRET